MSNSLILTLGDNTPFAWLVFFGYFFVVLNILKYPLKRQLTKDARFFWKCILGVLIILGINKQLDLQTILFEWMRVISIEYGWYNYKMEAKRLFVLIFVFCSVLLILMFGIRFARLTLPHWKVFIGIISILLYIILKVFYFQHVAFNTKWIIFGDHLQWLEALGLLFVFWGAKANNTQNAKY